MFQEETPHTRYQNDKGGKFWGNLGAGVLAYCPDTERFLVSLRSSKVNEPNTWGIIGGKLDAGEDDLKEVATREFVEETSYEGKIDLFPLYVFKDEKGTFEYHNFLGIVEKEFEPVLDWETEKTGWVTLSELKSLKRKHFGLEALLKHSGKEIEKIANDSTHRKDSK
jgi:8-oxo-dGTP pyrophosphatase MutT (NUDIX family)